MPLWLSREPLVLASKSEIRRAILQDAGIPIEVQAADIDERAIEQCSTPRDAGESAALLAREKARTVAARCPGRLVLGADQTLALGKQRFSTPSDRAGARNELEALRGRTHELHSAIALAQASSILWEHREVARLTMRAFSDQFLEAYVAAAGPGLTASVGGYHLARLGRPRSQRLKNNPYFLYPFPPIYLPQLFSPSGYIA